MFSEKIDTNIFPMSGLEKNNNKPSSSFINLPLELSFKFPFSILPHFYQSEINKFIKTKQFYIDAG